MPGGASGSNLKLEKISTGPASDLRQLEIQYNNGILDYQMNCLAGTTDMVWGWSSAISASGQALGRGSTDTNIGSGAFRFIITGQAASEAKAAVAAGTAIGAQTVPADTWAVYALDVATGGTITVSPGAANATTGYATEALAIAAVPARVTAKARMGYITVKTAAGLAWIAATDALAGGASGNVASATNYYPFDGCFAPTGQAYGPNGVVTANPPYPIATSAWTGGRNGVLIATVLSKGGTDTNLQSTAFTYNCNGICNIAKTAVAAGTAFGALGTIPASKWGIIVAYINTAGTISFQSGPANYLTGYATEAAAIGDLGNIFPTATATNQVCRIGYVTIKASASGWVAGTDALAGGASGNPASGTNYYPTPGITLLAGQQAAQIASRSGTPLTSANY